MARTALYAPAHRVAPRVAPGSGNGAPDQAPSLDFGGSGIQDPRLPYNTANSVTGAGIVGWIGTGLVKVASAAPSTKATANIAALANVVTGTAMTLVSSTGSGVTVVGVGGFLALPSLRTIAAGTLALDGLPGYVRMGSSFYTTFYDPTLGVARCVSITGTASGTGGNFLISGYDWYGYPMSQLLTVGAGVTTANTTKAFKFISSVVPQFTDAHNYSVGTADIFGLNVAADFFGDVDIVWNNVLALTATFTAAVTTSPATTTTGDVRGTFTASSAADGTKRLDIFVAPSLARLTASNMAVGLFGVAQV